jgi:hypothetical protein
MRVGVTENTITKYGENGVCVPDQKREPLEPTRSIG